MTAQLTAIARDVPLSWRWRRVVFFSLLFATTLTALWMLGGALATHGVTPLEFLLFILYGILFTWICGSFWTAVFGFFMLVSGGDRLGIRRSNDSGVAAPIDPSCKVALVMPIYNEEPARIFAGLQAVWESLRASGESERFEMFVLSDTRDASIWIEEELRWQALCRAMGAEGRIFYRNREHNHHRKSGNLADFCERWGERYRYMVVLDADSIMTGETLVQMVGMMERNPRVALIQVPPVAVNRETLFARMLQFAGSLYGRLFTAGLAYWQLGDSNYWGHNAILRTAAFAAHCGLPVLPGRPPLGGPILSHDFVEAALLRRGGWEVWLAADLGGSYEEIPPTLIDYVKRDRRWCQGNLQHARMLFAPRLWPISRLHLAMGVMSYLASPLWLIFIVVTGIEAYIQTQTKPVYFFGDYIFPVWPVSHAFEMMSILVATLSILFVPKILALMLLLGDAKLRRSYGGFVGATVSVVFETLFSVLIAPVLMLVQSKFVLAALLRRDVGWPTQDRNDHQTRWLPALQMHGAQTVTGLVAGIVTFIYVPDFFGWLTPVIAGLLLSIPLSMWSSRSNLGRGARKLGLFLTPEESDPPLVLQQLRRLAGVKGERRDIAAPATLFAVLKDPTVVALHAALLPAEPPNRRLRHHLEGLMLKLEEDGPAHLTATEQRALVSHRESLMQLHFELCAGRIG